MNAAFENASVLVVHWLMHCGWTLLAIGGVAWIGIQVLAKSSAQSRSNWTLSCLALVALSIPVSAFLSTTTIPENKFAIISEIESVESIEIASDSLRDDHHQENVDHSILDDIASSSDKLKIADKLQSVAQIGGTHLKKQSLDQTAARSLTAERFEPVSQKTDRIVQNDSGNQVLTSLEPEASAFQSEKLFLIDLVGSRSFQQIAAASYLVGLLFMLARLTLASIGYRRFKKTCEPLADDRLTARVKDLAQSIGLKFTPVIMQCQRLVVPMVAGIWKPTVLLPVSILTEMTVEQVESILLHELAHLKRRDHLIVVVQRVVEAILFFHPVTWWLGRELDAQREAACDDVVLGYGTSRVTYAQSLLQIASCRSANQLTVAADGANPSQLVSRIRRILDEPVTKKTNCHAALALIGLPMLLLAMFFLRPSQAQVAPTPPDPVAPVIIATDQNELPSNLDDPSKDFYSPISGTVLDAEQRPIKNATVIIQEHHIKRGLHFWSMQGEPFPWRIKKKHRQLFEYKTDEKGEFMIDQLQVPPEHQYIDSPYPITIMVHADQHSVAWKHLDCAKNDPIQFVLDKSVPQSLKVQSEDGSDILEVNAKVVGFQDSQNMVSNSRKMFSNSKLTKDVLMVTNQTTNLVRVEQNELTVSNLGPDQVAIVRLSADQHKSEIVYISQSAIETGEINDIVIAGSTHRLKRLARLKVNVVEKATGKPLPEAQVSVSWTSIDDSLQEGQTGANGTALVKNLPIAMDCSISVQPPAGTNLLAWNDSFMATAKKLQLTNQKEPLEITIKLAEGTPISGKVIDAKTKQGIQGVEVTFDALLTTGVAGQATIATTDAEGQYRMVVPNVLGKIRLASYFNGYFNSWTKNSESYRPNGMHDVRKSKKVLPLELYKQSTAPKEKLRLDITYPDGKPAAGSRVKMSRVSDTGSYSKLDSQKTDAQGQINLPLQTLYQRELVVIAFDRSGEFATRASMKSPQKLETWPQFLDFQKQLVAKKKTPASPAATMSIVLQPVAKIKGTLISPVTREPVAGATVYVANSPKDESDERGAYEVSVIPNLETSISISHPKYLGISHVIGDDKSEKLKPSEVRTLRHPMMPRDPTLAQYKFPPTNYADLDIVVDPTMPESSSTGIASAEPSATPKPSETKNREVEIAVVDPFGEPTSTEVEFWKFPIGDLNAKDENENPPAWKLIKRQKMESPIRLPITPKTHQCIVARSEQGLVGFVEFNSSSSIEQNRLILKLKKPNQAHGSVIDYDTGKPIVGATIGIRSAPPWQTVNLPQEREITTDINGSFEIDGLIPRMYTRLTVSAPKFRNFGSISEDFQLQRSNGNTSPMVIELLSESTYQRTLAAARLSLPNTEDLSLRESLEVIQAHFKRRKISQSGRFRDAKSFVNTMRTKPSFAYTEAIGAIADQAKKDLDDQENVDVWFDSLQWLLKHRSQFSTDGLTGKKASTDLAMATAEELFDNHLHHVRFKDAFSMVKKYRRTNEWLESILNDHSDHHVRGLAAIELATRYATISYFVSQRGKFDASQLASNQAKQREYAELVIEKYSDVKDQGYSNKTIDYRAKHMIKMLDQFGVGGKPPPLSGTTLAGGRLSTSEFGNKLFVIHFVNFAQTDPLDGILPMRAIRQEFGDQIQLIGIAKGREKNKNSVKQQISEAGIEWPFLWHGVPEQNHRNIQIGGGIRWGEAYVDALRRHRSIVLDVDGKIISMGLEGEPLAEFVRERLAKTSD